MWSIGKGMESELPVSGRELGMESGDSDEKALSEEP